MPAAQPPPQRDGILDLQRRAGNRAVTQLLKARGRGGPLVQRWIHAEDMTPEMKGAHFTVTEATTANGISLRKDEEIEITAWDNAQETATARQLPPAKPAVQFQVPKRVLRPVASGVAEIAPYSPGLGGVVKDFDAGQAKIDTENTRKGGSRPDEVKRLADLQKNRLVLLNKRLIQGSFLNRFDASIKTWVDFYNAKFGYTGKNALDPNLVKAMMYQETKMGTEGEFLDLKDPAPNRRTRQNVLQNIDSSGEALLEMIPEEDAALAAKHKFPDIRKDALKAKDTEDFLWADPRFVAAVNEFFAKPAGGTARNEDYDFWIKSGVRWLVSKRRHSKKIKSWEEAARAYNGDGPDARNYKRLARERMAKAKKSQAKGTEYVPDLL